MNPRTRRLRKLRRRQARRDAPLARVAAMLRKAQIPGYYAWLKSLAEYREWVRARMLASLRGGR